jgi:hypothetical protein
MGDGRSRPAAPAAVAFTRLRKPGLWALGSVGLVTLHGPACAGRRIWRVTVGARARVIGGCRAVGELPIPFAGFRGWLRGFPHLAAWVSGPTIESNTNQ